MGNSAAKAVRVVLLSAVTFALLATTAKAQASLEGEAFGGLQSETVTISNPQCTNFEGTGSFSFSATGVALGPYTGTFEEQGTVKFENRQVTEFNSTFKIYPPGESNPIVTGTKSLIPGRTSYAICTVAPFTEFFAAEGVVSYTASGNGFTDSGEATFAVDRNSAPELNLVLSQGFLELFYLSNGFVATLTPGRVTGGGDILHVGGGTGVSFGFNARNDERGLQGSGVVIDRQANVRINILNVTGLAVAGTHATFRGRAQVNGVEQDYRIDVDDLGEPGTPGDTFKIVTDSYVNGGLLTGGNIQIHKKPEPTP